jgi:ubiquinone/menaquinone biosynthesis C-methylase UbiE
LEEAHRERVAHAFTGQAAAFEDPRHRDVFGAGTTWLLEGLPRSPRDLVLDVAAGTGHVARQLAPQVHAVIALDATEAMLAQGREAACREGMRNVLFMRGEAEALPFLAESFDAVCCRFALHHLEDPAAAVAEMARCVRPGGHVLLADLVRAQDGALAAAQDRLERLRDPSHGRLLTPAGLESLLAGAGMPVVDRREREVPRELEPWLAQARPEPAAAQEVRDALRAELRGGPATGLSPAGAEGELRFVQRFAAVVGRRPA